MKLEVDSEEYNDVVIQILGARFFSIGAVIFALFMTIFLTIIAPDYIHINITPILAINIGAIICFVYSYFFEKINKKRYEIDKIVFTKRVKSYFMKWLVLIIAVIVISIIINL
jgi:hypothetical protein